MSNKNYEKKPGEFTYFLNYQNEGPDGPYYTNVNKKKNKDPIAAYAIPKEEDKMLVKIGEDSILLTPLNGKEGVYMNSNYTDNFTFFANKGNNQYGQYLRISKVVKQLSESTTESSNPERQYGS